MHSLSMRYIMTAIVFGSVGCGTNPVELPGKGWCESQGLSGDTSCVDFDEESQREMPGWSDYSFNNGGRSAVTEDESASLPGSLRLEAPGTQLRQWQSDGDAVISSVEIRASLKPDSASAPQERPVATQVLCARVGRSEGCLMYAASVGTQTTFAASYTGFFLQWRHQAKSVHPSVGITDCAIEQQLPADEWSDVTLHVEGDALYFEAGEDEARCDGLLDQAASATVSVGLASPTPWGAYVDNIAVEVARER